MGDVPSVVINDNGCELECGDRRWVKWWMERLKKKG